jgi:hypothetical protein
MNTALLKLDDSAGNALEQTRKSIEAEKSRLSHIEQLRNQEVTRCQMAYDRCRSYRTEDGYPLPCVAESRALEIAQIALAEARRQQKHFADQVDSYIYQATHLQQSINTNVRDSRVYLEEHISEGLHYLRSRPEELGSISGAGTHGDLYKDARKEWFRRGASGQLRQEGSDLTGWMRQEVNRGSYRSPGSFDENRNRFVNYYDTGHFVAGIDIPENFRWEHRRDNRHRPHAARRYNLPFTYN